MAEGRISPALIIGGVAAAAITGALIYLATTVKAAPPTEFAYVSDIERHYESRRTDYFTVDVQNIGNTASTCTLEFWRLARYTYEWELIATISHNLQPGEVKTFGGTPDTWVWTYGGYGYPDHWYAKFVGPPGEVSMDGGPR